MKKRLHYWCTEDEIKLPETYKEKHYRCPRCGKRLKVMNVYAGDSLTGRDVPELILFKKVKPHKTKVKYRNDNRS